MSTPLPCHWTLTRYLIEERRRFPAAGGDLNALLLDLSLACKAVARTVAFGEIQERAEGADAPGGARASLCGLANRLFEQVNDYNGKVAGMTSLHAPTPRQLPQGCARGKYLLLFDPLDGSGATDVNVSTGSIFSILRAPAEVEETGRDLVEADFLQSGATQVAAGYALYGPATMLVLSVGNGVAGFTLDPVLGDFMLTHPAIRIPDDACEFAIDSANSRHWALPVRRYVDECLAGRPGVRNKDFNMRWIASTVAETHRILMRGGVFLHPRDTREPAEAGQMRLLYEANPIAFLIEQAGGRASTGRRPVLDVAPCALGQRVGFVFGSRREVERIERYHAQPSDADRAAPLFAERGLFRT